MKCVLVSLALFVAASACGGPPAPSTVAHPPGGAGPAASSAPVTTPQGPRRGASDAMKQAFSYENPMVVVYSDFRGLMRTSAMAALGRSAVAMLASLHATPPQKKCVEDVLASFQEVAIGTDRTRTLVLARIDPSATAWVGTCLLGISTQGTKVVTIPGAKEAWQDSADVVALSPEGLLVMGPMDLVERALAGKSDGGRLAEITLGEDEYVAWSAIRDQQASPATGSVLVNDERFWIAGDVELASEMVAEKLERRLAPSALAAELPALEFSAAQTQGLLQLASSLAVRRAGRHLLLKLELREPAADQARDLGAAASAMTNAVQREIDLPKRLEAQRVVAELGRSVVMDWEAERPSGPPRSKKKLVSYPAVPNALPRGVSVQSTASDWKPWAPLRFTMETPQYYQYEVKASKDGESAEIVGRCDLHDDKKISMFKITLKVERPANRIRVSRLIEETDAQQ